MSVIDKGMYETLKNWWDGKTRDNELMMYMNIHDRVLSNATVRRLMYDILKEDIHGEMYVSFYSAKNFLRNMREYFTHIGELYYKNPGEDDPIEDIIDEYPPTCGWIMLIVEDMEVLTDQPEELQELFKAFVRFASKCSSVLLIGNGNYNDVFSKCEYALAETEAGINATEKDNKLMIGCYDQEKKPKRESVMYESEKDHLKELNFYWDTMYEQLEKGYFDFEDFKPLFKETMEYIIPRVSKQKIYRKDLRLIENIGVIEDKNGKNIDGCKPWEYDAGREFAMALHNAIVNTYGYNDDFSKGGISFDVKVEDPEEDCGAVHIAGCLYTTITVQIDNVLRKLEDFAEVIHIGTYEGDNEKMWGFLQKTKLDADDCDIEESVEKAEKIGFSLRSLMDGIKDVADKTVNKEPGMKVLRYKGPQSEDVDLGATADETNSNIKILCRDYDVKSDRIKGIDKLEQPDVEACKLSRYIVVLDEDGYTINEDGNAEMTQKAQKEYDDFVSRIRLRMQSDGIKAIDEGYGECEDELEWHITACFMKPEEENVVGCVYEIDTCVRTDEMMDLEDQTDEGDMVHGKD